jgi:uncharacterized repeat protein (TIGR01451 family)
LADIPRPCSDDTYENLNCCDKNIGISIVQPKCHCLPSGEVVTNPCYVSSLNRSFWTYKLITDCDADTVAITSFAIPICEIIKKELLTVSEKIDGCGEWTSVPYTLSKSDKIFGDAPEGFQFVIIDTNNRYTKGVSVAYRLELKGNFPVATQPISINTNSIITVFDCNGGFLVPECNPQGKLSINKDAKTIIENNQSIIEYSLEISNIGNATLEDVVLSDILFLPTQLTSGNISTSLEKLNIITNKPGQITINGSLGKLEPGSEIIVTYNVPIIGISNPGSYIINNLATVTSEGTEATATSSTTIDAVQLESNKCCNVLENGVAEYIITIANVGDSPSTQVNIVDTLVIPTGVIVKFLDFSGCTVVFANNEKQVPTNVNMQGPADIKITCDKINIPQNSNSQKIIRFELISSSVYGETLIKNELDEVNPTIPDSQIFLGTGILPSRADLKVTLSIECMNPCNKTS